MKHQILISLLGMAGLMASCADTDMEQLAMKQPETLAAYDYLKSYDVLKNYDAHLGTTIDAQQFLAKGMEYRIVASNFAELLPASTFSHAKTLKPNGNLDTTTVVKVRDLAASHEMHLLGSPLIWHKQQNVSYLNGLLAPNVVRPEGDEGGYCLKMTHTAQLTQAADAQVAYTFAKTPRVEPGITYKLKMWMKGTSAGTIQVATYANGKGSLFKPSVEVSTEWKRVEITNTIVSGMKGLSSILFNLGEYVGTLYVDDIELVEFDPDRNKEVGKNLNTQNTNLDDAETTAQSLAILTNDSETLEDVGVSALGEGYDPDATYVEKTDEEKKTILTAEMQKYLAGIIDAGKDVVNDWMVVTDPLEEPSDDATCFFWQKYLGATDYAALAFHEAAKHTDGRLYIAATDLLSHPSEATTLKTFVQTLEQKGCQVDGYAISVGLSTDDTEALENLSQVLTSLAATGKLIRLTDVQVWIAGEAAAGEQVDGKAAASEQVDGEQATNRVKTADVTELQLQQQAHVLGKILTAYRSLVPENQQGGVTLHATLDEADGSPLGLWDVNYNRKHVYGSLVDGIK